MPFTKTLLERTFVLTKTLNHHRIPMYAYWLCTNPLEYVQNEKKIQGCQHQDSIVDSPQVSPQSKQVHTVLQTPIETVYSNMKATAPSLVTTSRSTTLYPWRQDFNLFVNDRRPLIGFNGRKTLFLESVYFSTQNIKFRKETDKLFWSY